MTPSWSTAYYISSGALILESYSAVGGFGKFCGVVVALCVISNNVPGTYAAALDYQVLGRYGKMVPRYLWVCAIVLVYFVCAIAGRDYLFGIFQNFLALMGYWVVIFVSIVLEEHLIFRPNGVFNWSAWENKEHLPIGAFLDRMGRRYYRYVSGLVYRSCRKVGWRYRSSYWDLAQYGFRAPIVLANALSVSFRVLHPKIPGSAFWDTHRIAMRLEGRGHLSFYLT